MIRSSARRLVLSANRGRTNSSTQLSPSLLKPCAGSIITSHDRREEREPSTCSLSALNSRNGFSTVTPLMITTFSSTTWSNQMLSPTVSITTRQMSSNSSDLPSFGSKPITPEADAETAISSALNAADLTATPLPFEPTMWPSDQVLLLLNWVNETILYDYPYAVTIGATTLAFRILLFPIFAMGQKNASRMAHMQPELTQLKENLDKLGNRVDQQDQVRYMNQTRALFKKYDCNPLKGLVAPLVTAPFFLSMFFGLKNAPDYFPEVLKDGGILWFTDLTQPDPYVALPVFSAMTFLGMTEVGKEQMMASDPNRGRIMLNAFRALAVVMVPMTMYFNSAVFVYWTVNNTFSFVQSLVFKNQGVKNVLGIWDPPKPVPGKEPKSIFDEVQKLMNKKEEAVNALAAERIKAHNEYIEKEKKMKKLRERK